MTSAIFFNYFLHGIPVPFHIGSQLELGAGAVEVLGFVVDVEVVVPLEIISEETHTALHRHQLGTPRQGLLFQRGERFPCCLQEALGVNFKQFHAEIDFREVSFVLGAVVGTEADRIPKIIGSKPRHDRVKVDNAKTFAGRFVEQDVVQLGVVVGDAQRQLARRQQIHHNVILCFAGADKLNFALHLCGTTHELGFLARTIDNMVNEIGLLAQRWSDDQRKMRELELQTLQYQINPHFLFNTLNTLKWIATLNHVTPVSHGIDALSSLLQSTLIKKDELIPFDDELRNLKNYCDIQQLRYAGRFEMEYQIEDAAGYWTVPRFILQPLVENSILHGTADEDDFVTITVRATVSENLLTIHISDTGCGFDPSAIKEKNSERFSGIGLSNVDERMRLHYGNEYGLTIESAPGTGTQCILRIPNEAIR